MEIRIAIKSTTAAATTINTVGFSPWLPKLIDELAEDEIGGLPPLPLPPPPR